MNFFFFVILEIYLKFSTKTTTESVLLPIGRVIDLQRTIIFSFALLQVLLCLVSHLPSLSVTWITKVMRSKAEEESDAAAKSALIIDILIFVLLAIGVTVVCSFQHI